MDASPSDADALDALHRHLMQLNIAVLTLKHSPLLTGEIREQLNLMGFGIRSLDDRADAVIDGFQRQAELAAASPMAKAKADLAQILALKAKRGGK